LRFQLAWLKFLPKPGLWMEKFKIAMGFPMLATAIWMCSLAAPHFGRGGILWLGLYLIFLALAAWIFGEFFQRGQKHRMLAIILSFLFLGIGYGYALEKELHWRNPAKISAAAGSLKESPDGIDWQPWSLAAVEKARAEGHPVLADFTAEWCLTCQVNKKSSLEISAVRAKLKEIKAVALLADNTLENEAITAELKKYDRAGVPLVLVYPKNTNEAAIVLPAFLTPGIVLDALNKAAK
ncbi:MAG: thioredoxin family protein, partial [Limisphaerales bacterium]